MAIYKTQIQRDVSGGDWFDALPILLVIAEKNRKWGFHDVVPDHVDPKSGHGAPSTGTQVSWSSPDGNGSITFYDAGESFHGSRHDRGEGPVGYRGQRITEGLRG